MGPFAIWAQLCYYRVVLGEPKNQFCCTHATLSTSRREAISNQDQFVDGALAGLGIFPNLPTSKKQQLNLIKQNNTL